MRRKLSTGTTKIEKQSVGMNEKERKEWREKGGKRERREK